MKRPRRNEAVIINDDADAPSFLNPVNGEIYVTNKVGKRVIELADGERDAEAIADTICGEFKGAPEDVIREEVHTFLEQSAEKGLVEWQT